MAGGVLVTPGGIPLAGSDGSLVFDDECCCYPPYPPYPPYGDCAPCCTKLVGGITPKSTVGGIETKIWSRRIFTVGYCLTVIVDGLPDDPKQLICQGRELTITAVWTCPPEEDGYNNASITWDQTWCHVSHAPESKGQSEENSRFGVAWPDLEGNQVQATVSYNSCANTGGTPQYGAISVSFNGVGVVLNFEDCPRPAGMLCPGCAHEIPRCQPCCDYVAMGPNDVNVNCGPDTSSPPDTITVVRLGPYILLVSGPRPGRKVYCEETGGAVDISAALFHATDPEYLFDAAQICLHRGHWMFPDDLAEFVDGECTIPEYTKCKDGRSDSFSLVAFGCDNPCPGGASDVLVTAKFKDSENNVVEISASVLQLYRCPGGPCCCGELPEPCCNECYFPTDYPDPEDQDPPMDAERVNLALCKIETGGKTQIKDAKGFGTSSFFGWYEFEQFGESGHSVRLYNTKQEGCPPYYKYTSDCYFRVPLIITDADHASLIGTLMSADIWPPGPEATQCGVVNATNFQRFNCWRQYSGDLVPDTFMPQLSSTTNCPSGGGSKLHVVAEADDSGPPAVPGGPPTGVQDGDNLIFFEYDVVIEGEVQQCEDGYVKEDES
jgi:hypothetical protein